MRFTGIRIGELQNLSFDCIEEHPNGNKFLKVPVGKLYTERRVPLNDETIIIRTFPEKSRSFPHIAAFGAGLRGLKSLRWLPVEVFAVEPCVQALLGRSVTLNSQLGNTLG